MEALDDQAYGFSTRFEGVKGANPEELIASNLQTTAQVTLEKKGDGLEITAIHLGLRGTVPGANQANFQELANSAKVNSPVSKLFKASISLEAILENGPT